MGVLLQNEIKEVFEDFFLGMSGGTCLCVGMCGPACVFILRFRVLERTTFSLYFVYTWTGPGPPWLPSVRGGAASPPFSRVGVLGGAIGHEESPV